MKKKSRPLWGQSASGGWEGETIENTIMEKDKKPRGYWSVKENIFKAAKNCNTRSEFKREYPNAYRTAYSKGWLDEMEWFVNGRSLPRRWTKEKVFEAAKECRTRSNFERQYPGAYKTACDNGWLDEMYWFVSPQKPSGYWTRDRVFDEARKYTTRSAFKKGCNSAYVVARKNGWLDEMNWFISPANPHGYWTKERVFEEARKYNTKSEFAKGCDHAYRVALEKGWFDEMDWIVVLHVDGYWTRDKVFEESHKYSNRTEFQKKCASAYHVARINNWLDEMDWLLRRKNPYEDDIYVVYRYSFKELNTVYIGLTMNETKRDLEHKRRGPVSKFASLNNIVMPEMEVLVDGLYQEEALEYEDRIVTFCKNIGLNVLNKAKTGIGSGSLGGGIKKWSKPSVMEESKKYRTRNEFKKGCPGAYGAARRYGWIDEMVWLQEGKHPNGYWTKERVFEEASKYETPGSFRKGCSSAHNMACKKGWLKLLFPKAS